MSTESSLTIFRENDTQQSWVVFIWLDQRHTGCRYAVALHPGIFEEHGEGRGGLQPTPGVLTRAWERATRWVLPPWLPVVDTGHHWFPRAWCSCSFCLCHDAHAALAPDPSWNQKDVTDCSYKQPTAGIEQNPCKPQKNEIRTELTGCVEGMQWRTPAMPALCYCPTCAPTTTQIDTDSEYYRRRFPTLRVLDAIWQIHTFPKDSVNS